MEKNSKVVDQIKLSGLECDPAEFEKAVKNGLEAVITSEPDVTKYDTGVGNGDCGTALKREAEAILSMLSESNPIPSDIVVLMSEIARVVKKTMDGTSGAIHTIFLSSLVTPLCGQSISAKEITVNVWANALEYASSTLSTYRPARLCDRTWSTRCIHFIEALKKTKSAMKGADAAEEGALKTESMTASLGRSVDVGKDAVKDVPEPGAWGLCQFFLGLAKK